MKNKIKKICRAALLPVICACLLAGCGSGKTKSGATEKLQIVTTAFPPYDFVRQLAGDRAELTMLLKPGGEAHTYEPTPWDILAVENCDLFVYIGGESENWADQLLDGTDNREMETLKLLDCVEGLKEEIVEGMYLRGKAGHEEEESGREETDEHVWTDPRNVIAISRRIHDRLCELDPMGKAEYDRRLEEYIQKLEELDRQFSQIVAQGSRKTVVFGDRFPFRYFAKAYGLTYFAAFPGCSSESEPSVATMIFLTEQIRKQKIPVVFTLEMSSGKIGDALCEETGAKRLTFHSCHNVSRQEFESGETYVSLMEKNAESLREALK